MGNKTSHKRTPAEDGSARQGTQTRKNRNVEANQDKALANVNLEGHGDMGTLNPIKRGQYETIKGDKVKVQPFTNKGNGSPTRNSQIKRAVARIGKSMKVES